MVGLLAFMAIAVIVTSAAVIVSLLNTQRTSDYALGEELFAYGEGGLENATLRTLRDPNFAGSTTTITEVTPQVSVILNITGSGTKTATVRAEMSGNMRKFQSVGSFTGTVFTLSGWQELP